MSAATSLLLAFRARLGELAETGYRAERWHSATFAGVRHIFTLEAGPGQDIPAFARDIAEDDIAVPGGFVADIIVSQSATDPRRIEISALTIEA